MKVRRPLRKREFESQLQALANRRPRGYALLLLGAKKERGQQVVTPLAYGSHRSLAQLLSHANVQTALAEALQGM